MTFSQTLKAWRSARKLTQAGASQRIGVNLRTLQDWEQGRRTPRGFAKTAILKIVGVLLLLLGRW